MNRKVPLPFAVRLVWCCPENLEAIDKLQLREEEARREMGGGGGTPEGANMVTAHVCLALESSARSMSTWVQELTQRHHAHDRTSSTETQRPRCERGLTTRGCSVLATAHPAVPTRMRGARALRPHPGPRTRPPPPTHVHHTLNSALQNPPTAKQKIRAR